MVELRPLVLKDTMVPEFIKAPEQAPVTMEQLQALGAQTATVVAESEVNPEDDMVLDEEAAAAAAVAGTAAQPPPQVVNVIVGTPAAQVQIQGQGQAPPQPDIPIQFEPQFQQMPAPPLPAPPPPPQPGPEAVIMPPPLPTQQGGYAPQTIIVDTSPHVMMQAQPQPQPQPQQQRSQSTGSRRLRFAPTQPLSQPAPSQMINDDPEYKPPSNVQRINVRKIE